MITLIQFVYINTPKHNEGEGLATPKQHKVEEAGESQDITDHHNRLSVIY